MKRPSFAVEQGAQATVGHAGIDGYGAGRCVQGDDLVHLFQGDELVSAVGNLVEAVARAKDFQPSLFFDEFLGLFERLGRVQILRAIFKIARPISKFFHRGPRKERRKQLVCGEAQRKASETIVCSWTNNPWRTSFTGLRSISSGLCGVQRIYTLTTLKFTLSSIARGWVPDVVRAHL